MQHFLTGQNLWQRMHKRQIHNNRLVFNVDIIKYVFYCVMILRAFTWTVLFDFMLNQKYILYKQYKLAQKTLFKMTKISSGCAWYDMYSLLSLVKWIDIIICQSILIQYVKFQINCSIWATYVCSKINWCHALS
jgi:hypothetical protein